MMPTQVGQELALAPNLRIGEPLRTDGPEQVPPGRAFEILWRRKLQVIATALLLSAGFGAALVVLPSYYDATALLMVDTRQSSFRDLQATMAPAESDIIAIATQVSIVKSPAMAATVVDRLGLTQVPEFARRLDAPPGLLQRAQSAVMDWLHQPQAPSPTLDAGQRRQLTAGLLQQAISVVNDGKSYIISVRARTGNPKLSADIANAYVAAFLDYNQDEKVGAIHRANELLERQLPPLEERVRLADEAVESYQSQHGLILNSTSEDGAAGSTVADQQLMQINTQLLAATRDLSQRQASLSQITEAQRTGRLEAAPEVVSSTVIAGLRAQQAQLASQAASLAQTQSEANPVLRSAQAAEVSLQRRIGAEVSRIAASVESQVASSQAQVDQLHAELGRLQSVVGKQSQSSVVLRQLQSKARAERVIYQDYLGRFEASLNTSNLQVSDATAVSSAEAPIGKSGPPRTLYALVAVMAAAGLSAGLALLTERVRGGVRTLSQLEMQTGLYGLGFIPEAPRNLRRALRAGRRTAYLESVNLVGDLLRFGRPRHRAQVVLVTSAAPAEGKTVFAASLAASVGASGGNALLIDCDLRRPSVSRLLRLKEGSEADETTAIIRRDEMPGVDVVTFRGRQRDGRDGDLMAQIRTLVGKARERYDLVVLDAPPVLPFPDASKLSLEADGAVVVVRWRHTSPAMVLSAMRTLSAYGVNVLGGVVTQVKQKEVAASDGGHGKFYRHYAPYLP